MKKSDIRFTGVILALILGVIANMLYGFIPKTNWLINIIIIVALVNIYISFILLRKVRSEQKDNKDGDHSKLISIAKMPITSPDLFGRERYLNMLDKAWKNRKINIVSLVAWGGVGKTSLVNAWLNRMSEQKFKGIERVLGWSFYSQGASEGKQASADLFIDFALRWFGDPDSTKGSSWDKGERLAELVRKNKTLLILDGLEPLQNPIDCRIKDPALCCLLKELAHLNPGLCVVTTRLKIDDIRDDVGNSVEEIELENLSEEAGAQLLEKLEVKGTSDELKEAVKDFKGHALALTLLGTYLKTVYYGDIRQRDKIPILENEPKQGAHTRRVIESYEQWFKGKPELDILYIMGLFDKPAEGGAIEAVRKTPVIDGLTDKLQGLSHAEWMFAIENLRTARLLDKKDEHSPDELDCHPLVREHFGEKLKASNPKAWKEAHSRLYEWYKSTANEFPETLNEMKPLLIAEMHGCQSGKYEETIEIYENRINRTDDKSKSRNFLRDKLGAVSADLAILSHFFDVLWEKPIDDLTKDQKAFVLSRAGLVLYIIGRIKESIKPMQLGLEIYETLGEWYMAAQSARHLSEPFLFLGDFDNAEKYAKIGIEYANREIPNHHRAISAQKIQENKLYIQIVTDANFAYILHNEGRFIEAECLFNKAEQLQIEMEPEYYLLCRLHGYRYFDFLLDLVRLDLVKLDIVIKYANQTLEWPHQESYPLAKALHRLMLSRAYMLNNELDLARNNMKMLMSDLRQAGQPPFLIPGILAYAELHRRLGEFDEAQQDMNASLRIIDFCEMHLFRADYHLEYARLYFDMGEKEKAKENLVTAKEMIEKMGYHRRDKEVQELECKLILKRE